MTMKKIKWERRQYLKLEMYCYHETKMALDEYFLTSKQITHMQLIINAIDMALDIIEKTTNGTLKRKVIEDLYWYSRNLDYYGLSFKYNLHFNTLISWDRQFLKTLADIIRLDISP
jgi:hypothetical protein